MEDACHIAPSARITPPTPDIATPHSSITPALHVSSSLPLSLPFHFPSPLSQNLLTLSLPCSFFVSLTFISFYNHLTPPRLYHSFACLCHCVICCFFYSVISPHPLRPPPLVFLLWMDRDFLFTRGNAVSALLTNQQEGISARDEPGMLVFLTASHVSLSGVCVSHTWVVVITDRGVVVTCHPALSHWRTKPSH